MYPNLFLWRLGRLNPSDFLFARQVTTPLQSQPPYVLIIGLEPITSTVSE